MLSDLGSIWGWNTQCKERLMVLIYWPIKPKVMGGSWLTGLIYFTRHNCWRKMTSHVLQVVPVRLTFAALPPALDFGRVWFMAARKCLPSLNLNRDMHLSPSSSFPGRNWFASASKQQKHDKYLRNTSQNFMAACLLHQSCVNAHEYKDPEPKLTPSSGWLWLLGFFIVRSRS